MKAIQNSLLRLLGIMLSATLQQSVNYCPVQPGRKAWQMRTDAHGINSYPRQLVQEVYLPAYTIKGVYKTQWSYSMVKLAS